jgi:hypothetical protein
MVDVEDWPTLSEVRHEVLVSQHDPFGQAGVDKDREKTALMEEAGWQVIRVRERPLDSIHVNDVMVDTGAPAKTAADLVLKKIVKVTGTEIPRLDEYLASEEPWRETEALAAIRAYQAERAAKKAANKK